jgi:hypothetical protein
MKFIFSAAFCLNLVFAYAQSGNFFLSHYSPGKDRQDNICFQARQQKNGIMYFATRGGILEFDGRSWNLINGNGAIYTIQISDQGTIYWGGAHGYGVVADIESNLPELKTLSTNVTDIFQSVQNDGKTYFLNQEKIFIVNNSTNQSSFIEATGETGVFTGIFEIGGEVVVNSSANVVSPIRFVPYKSRFNCLFYNIQGTDVGCNRGK